MAEHDYVFHACTKEGHLLKTLAEIMKFCLQKARLVVDYEGISLLEVDNTGQIYVSFFLEAENFEDYILNLPDDQDHLEIGIVTERVFGQLQSTKKNDHVSLFIVEGREQWLQIGIKKPDAERDTVAELKIQTTQTLEFEEMPEFNTLPILLPANEFQKMIKDMKALGNTVQVTAQGQFIVFRAEENEICNRKSQFGTYKDHYHDDPLYQEIFEVNQFSKLLKCTGITTKVKIFTIPGLPIKLKMAVGTLGNMEVCIRPIEEDNGRNVILKK